MMQSVRDNSQQDRRVYVGNLAYDVKWHHLKDFMRNGKIASCLQYVIGLQFRSWRSTVCRCTATSKWNVEGGQYLVTRVVFVCMNELFWTWVDGSVWLALICRDAGEFCPLSCWDISKLTE